MGEGERAAASVPGEGHERRERWERRERERMRRPDDDIVGASPHRGTVSDSYASLAERSMASSLSDALSRSIECSVSLPLPPASILFPLP